MEAIEVLDILSTQKEVASPSAKEVALVDVGMLVDFSSFRL